ncbi:hypothetical protein PFLG_01846 [Plasmodium falciparum RAJ116]|uniref:Uncharacterized protein n=1 Tax=Plasmodium falciparum RAJ116 TaxID=580058 RepID=A0A0L0CVW9_PLAFA|nr:hypothetical protein PFLG_01846 [Plasmodium falciparum RAJ116]
MRKNYSLLNKRRIRNKNTYVIIYYYYLLLLLLLLYEGTNGVLHSIIEKKQKFLLSHESSYGIICLGISFDKKLLALGEKSNKYIYCITNANTKSLFLCYDWLKEKLINICEICINPHNSSYIALLSIGILKKCNRY